MSESIKWLFEILFLPGILGAGILSSLSDIKTGKVKNSLIKKGFLYGLIIYALLLIWMVFRKYVFYSSHLFYLKLNYFPELIINLIIAFIVGFVLWKFDIWAAADTKLFALFSFLIPLTVYKYGRLPYFPSFALLVNIYMICFLYSVSVCLTKIRIKREDLKHFFLKKIPEFFSKAKIFKIIDSLLIYLVIFLIIFSFGLFKISASLSSLLLLYASALLIQRVIMTLLGKYKKIKIPLFLLVIAYLGFLLIFSSNPLSLKQLAQYMLFIVIFNLAFKLLDLLGMTDIRTIEIKELGENMIVTPKTVELLAKNKEFHEGLGQFYSDGLSLEQVEKIKDFFKEKQLEKIEIYKTFPFAPFIFIGAVATFIVRGSLISLLIDLKFFFA